MSRKYKNFDIYLSDYAEKDGNESCRVRVESSSSGEGRDEAVTFPSDLRRRLAMLDRRELKYEEIIALGIDIGKILCPPKTRETLLRSLPRGEDDPSLRIRVKCDDFPLETIAWEYAAIERESVTDRTNFLVLNSKTSLVRYQLLSSSRESVRPMGDRQIRFVGAFSSPEAQVQLDLSREREGIAQALAKVPRLKQPPHFLERAIASEFIDAITNEPTDIVHFAGHGGFGSGPDVLSGPIPEGYLLWEERDGSAFPYLSDVFASDLADKKVKLVVLSACRSSQTDGSNVWAGVAPALAKVGIPAVVGMQFSVLDKSSIAFAYRFYRSLGFGLSLDEAVSEARKEIQRCDPKGRDFGVPVLYFRCDEEGDSVLFPVNMPAPEKSPRNRAGTSGPGNPNINSILEHIARLSAYKELHDALHTVKEGGLTRMQVCVAEFPQSKTVEEFTDYAERFNTQLDIVIRVVQENRCEPILARGIRDSFSIALKRLFDALNSRNVDGFREAVEDLESVVATHASPVNTRLVACAEGLQLDELVKFLRNALQLAGVALADSEDKAIQELSSLGSRISNKVKVHNVCQQIEQKLGLIRRKEPNEFRELVKHWEGLKTCIDEVIDDWSPTSAPRLRACVQRLDQAVTKQDASLAREAFPTICSIIDTGFSKVDTDLKRLCGELQAGARSVKDLPSLNARH